MKLHSLAERRAGLKSEKIARKEGHNYQKEIMQPRVYEISEGDDNDELAAFQDMEISDSDINLRKQPSSNNKYKKL